MIVVVKKAYHQRSVRTATKSRHFGSKDALYESLKRDWIARNPNASSADYQAAMIKIARNVGF
ncbi:hypothetical protein SFMTTN_0225 [Sulfuriferula multivorans]|uniref:Uncharacterized protein n=1 Tax=Sulfuriferula multivorans TaxID=1559896 RepID=A0A401J9X2_9PROT|nr:hypothetical protein [Sulfuriferula multivorans]GBL44429.1 hypothetical protein SFMTTN_0225 [Sulfuriferula multivorans]